MGKVYLAHHPGIGRRSAIKVLHANLAGDPAAVSRFFTEARASNAIRHPNIVEIFDSGTLDSGAPYIIMEHLEGETLAARMARGLALGPALDFACQAASALAAAHSQQVVHRDLKPENLFITTDPRDGSPAARAGQGAGLRGGQAAGAAGGAGPPHAFGLAGGHAPLHVPRAVPGRGARSTSAATSTAWG